MQHVSSQKAQEVAGRTGHYDCLTIVIVMARTSGTFKCISGVNPTQF